MIFQAQFSPNTSLYPVCRAWIRNQPNNPNIGIKYETSTINIYVVAHFKVYFEIRCSPRKTDPKPSEEKMDVVKMEDKEGQPNLPPPEPMPKDEDGNIIDTRIPINLKPPEKLSSLDFLVNRVFLLTLYIIVDLID